jgi:limonene 1,2-monooxygenase
LISVGYHNPLWVTERLVLLDHLTRGRVILGAVADRAEWRLVGLVHCAETREEAYRDVAYDIEHWFRHFQSAAGLPHMSVKGDSVREMVGYVAESGLGAIGTPDDVRAQIHRLVAQSNGGFGADLTLAHEWANTQATRRSAEPIAKYMMPHSQGRAAATLIARASARAVAVRGELVEQQRQASEAATARHAAEQAVKRAAERASQALRRPQSRVSRIARQGRVSPSASTTISSSPSWL